MKKGKKIIIIMIFIICLSACNNKTETTISSEIQKNDDIYTHENLILNSKYNTINQYLNNLFNELNFDGKMFYATLDENVDSIKVSYVDVEGDTVFNFYFNLDQSFNKINVVYNTENQNSIDLVLKLFRYSLFDLNNTEINNINNILVINDFVDETKIGNYYIEKNTSGFIIFKTSTSNKATLNQNSNQTSNIQSNKTQTSNTTNSNKSKTKTTTSNKTTTKTTTTSNKTTTKKTTNNKTTTVSVSKQNALRSAKSYLSFSAFSRKGLIEQLKYEKYSTEDATYAVDHCGANWNEQALKSAKSYLRFSAFSYKGLKEQLLFEGFTDAQATYGVKNCGANWNEQAVKSASSYLKLSGFSRQGLIDQLEFEGFTHDQAVYGVTKNGL